MRRARPFIAALILSLPLAGLVEAKPRKRPAGKGQQKVAPSRKKPAEVKLRQEPVAPAEVLEPTTSRGPARIDFDDRLVQGQTNTSGAVYLYERKELRTHSMLQLPESFRTQTVQTVFGE